jgi:hypothetical protein
MLAKIDSRCGQPTGRKNVLFGGLSIFLIGDKGQLPPVCAIELHGTPKTALEIAGKGLYENFTTIITLQRNARQSDDHTDPNQQYFEQLLSDLRVGQCSKEQWEFLMTRMPGNIGLLPFATEF